MQELVLHKEKENKRTGFILSLGVHILILLLLLIPCLNYMDPPLEMEGIMVIFGNENAGEPQAQTKTAESATAAPSKVTPEPQNEPETKPKLVKTVPVPTETTKEPEPELESKIKEDNSEILAAQAKAKVEEEKRKQEEAAARAEQKKLDEERKKQEEAERKKKEYEAKKSKFGSLFGQGEESNKGEEEGKKGNPLGNPDKGALEGIAKASGRVGGGLSNRGVLKEPNFRDNTQKSGVVVVKICVNSKGNVISSKYTQKGSTTTDSYLVSLAEKEAKNYQFSSSDIEEQCGTITVEFKVR